MEGSGFSGLTMDRKKTFVDADDKSIVKSYILLLSEQEDHLCGHYASKWTMDWTKLEPRRVRTITDGALQSRIGAHIQAAYQQYLRGQAEPL